MVWVGLYFGWVKVVGQTFDQTVVGGPTWVIFRLGGGEQDYILAMWVWIGLYLGWMGLSDDGDMVQYYPYKTDISLGSFRTSLSFLLLTFTIQRTVWERGEAISLIPVYHSHLLHRHLEKQLGNYCRELNSAHSQQPDSKRKPLVSERKSLITKQVDENTCKRVNQESRYCKICSVTSY